LHPVRVPEGQLLGDHPAERHAEHEGVLPPHDVEQRGGVVGVIGHGVRPFGDFRLAQPPLVELQQLERDERRVVGQAPVAAQVAAGTGNEEQALPRPPQLVIELDPVRRRDRH
jgi:hypothetical protein